MSVFVYYKNDKVRVYYQYAINMYIAYLTLLYDSIHPTDDVTLARVLGQVRICMLVIHKHA